MDDKELERRYQLLIPYVVKAAREISEIRQSGKMTVRLKPDLSPVTNADEWGNEYFRQTIEKEFSGENILGEEDDPKMYPAGAECLWYIDPIDGTKNYVANRDSYYILIGFCYNGIPSLGIYHKPSEGITIVGYGNQTTLKLNGSDEPENIKVDLWDNEHPQLIMKHPPEGLKQDLSDRFGVKRYPYIPDNVDMLGPLFGLSNGFISYRKTSNWDLCAPAAIMRSVGYELPVNPDDTATLFNNGDWMQDFFYALPPNSPQGLKEVLDSYR